MAGHSETTTDHETVRHWAEERGGRPASIRASESNRDVGMLRIDPPGGVDDTFDHVSRDEWSREFDENRLAFPHHDERASGEGSTFFKLVRRDGG